jgi:hypothetical protein
LLKFVQPVSGSISDPYFRSAGKVEIRSLMKPNKIIAFFLTLVLSVQVIPLKQIAEWLSSAQITEEITHTVKSGKYNPAAEEIKHPFLLYSAGSGMSSFLTSMLFSPHQDEALYGRDNDDILSPPPNC